MKEANSTPSNSRSKLTGQSTMVAAVLLIIGAAATACTTVTNQYKISPAESYNVSTQHRYTDTQLHDMTVRIWILAPDAVLDDMRNGGGEIHRVKGSLPAMPTDVSKYAGGNGLHLLGQGSANFISDRILVTAGHVCNADSHKYDGKLKLMDDTGRGFTFIKISVRTDLCLLQVDDGAELSSTHYDLVPAGVNILFTNDMQSIGYGHAFFMKSNIGSILPDNMPGFAVHGNTSSITHVVPGMSGGALMNSRGQLVGVLSGADNTLGLAIYITIAEIRILLREAGVTLPTHIGN